MIKTIRETRQLVIDQMLDGLDIWPGDYILEPSAGSGDLADGIAKRKFNNSRIDCIELNEDRYKVLIEKGYNAIHADFLKVQPTKLYDFVIACPTYKDYVDTVHIMHVYEFLKPGENV